MTIFIPTQFGEIEIAYEKTTLIFVKLPRQISRKKQTFKAKNNLEKQLYKDLNNYFSGNYTIFNYQYHLTGTKFQQKVWQALQEIPYGQLRSYQDIANIINHPKAARAVGSACKKNPFPILIPCHRVTLKNKTLGNFSYGTRWKERLIKLEQMSPIC